MQTLKARIDHALEIFLHLNRFGIVIGLTASDWDVLCADVMPAHARSDDDLPLTRDTYEGFPIRHLQPDQASFVAHDFGTRAERHYPVEVLEPV